MGGFFIMGETIAKNKKAFHDYEIIEKFEAGMELMGSEVKAIREKRVNIKDSYVRFIKGEAFLLESHIGVLTTTHAYYGHEESRVRKLLLHKKQLVKLKEKVDRDGMIILALNLYFNHKNIVKIQIGLGKGKKLHDKRADMKDKTLKMEAKRAIKGDY